MAPFPYFLYLVLDPDFCTTDPVNIAETVMKNGVDILQLRYKGADIALFLHLAGQLRQVTRKFNVPLIINDRIDICLSVGADGVHLGQDDFPVEAARKLLGEKKIIGLSTHNSKQARNAHDRPVDYIGLGPVFATASKKKPDPTIGLDNLRDILAKTRLPCFPIGGVSSDNIGAVVNAGAERVALITAITRALDPADSARILKTAITR